MTHPYAIVLSDYCSFEHTLQDHDVVEARKYLHVPRVLGDVRLTSATTLLKPPRLQTVSAELLGQLLCRSWAKNTMGVLGVVVGVHDNVRFCRKSHRRTLIVCFVAV